MQSESKRPSALTVSLVLVIVVYRPVCSTRIFAVCKPGHEFWSTEKSACHPCTKCAPAFTLSPCAVHKDAVCGPLSALELDWSFLTTRRKSEMGQQTTDAVISEMLWRFPEVDEQRRKSSEVDDKISCDESTNTMTARNANDENGFPVADDLQESIVDSGQRRTSGEGGILWDWQTGSLVLAICACIVFFLVAGCSALIYVRQWRRMKRNFEPAGLEEISARLNLMVKAELPELTASGPKNPGDPKIRCRYLENLLDRNRKTPTEEAGWPETSGNLYIDERETPRSKRDQIARIHRNIERVLSQKSNRG